MIETIGNAPAWLSQPENRNSRPRSSGKIARLPANVREMINQDLADNVSYPDIISRLEAMGHHGINPQNVSNWAHSGYNMWQRHRERLDLMRLQSEANCELLRQLENGDPKACNRLNNLYMSAQLAQLMQDFDSDYLRNQLADDPINFFRLARSISAQTRNAYREQKLQLEIIRTGTVPGRRIVENPREPAAPSSETTHTPKANSQNGASEPPAHQAS